MKQKVRKRKMFVVIGALLVLIGLIMIWFNIPYSPIKSDFDKDVSALIQKNHLSDNIYFDGTISKISYKK